MDTNDKEIINASHAIDIALAKMNKDNRGEVAIGMLSVVRNLNDHIALKVWRGLEPNQPMSINKVAKKLISRAPYQFIGRFDKYLQKSLSHFTPDEDGAERLSIKYYPYLVGLKKLMHENYGVDILENIQNFIPDLDNKTQEYYDKIAEVLVKTSLSESEDELDNYYIHRVIPFFSKGRTFYEVTLEPADEKPNKFNRITAFCKGEFISNYCTALSFTQKQVHVFGVDFPVNIITGWETSIRPCEIKNFAKLLGIGVEIKRTEAEYSTLMNYMTGNRLTLLDIIDFDDEDYEKVKNLVVNSTRDKRSKIFAIFKVCRYFSERNTKGKNLLRYLLCRMNNRIIKMQFPYIKEGMYSLNIPRGCQSFDELPLSFNPKGHRANFSDVLESLNEEVNIPSLLAKVLSINLSQQCKLYTSFDELKEFGDEAKIKNLVEQYNDLVYSGFKPDSEIGIYKEYLYIKGDESNLLSVLKNLSCLAQSGLIGENLFNEEKIKDLENYESPTERLTDPAKKEILLNMFTKSRVRLVYGSAGTGKSTLINYVTKVMAGTRKVFLSKTNPAKENLRHKVTHREEGDEFLTIDTFLKNRRYSGVEYDLIVVDECSTVKNDEILKIINRIGGGVLLLVGDIYQIQAIGFGNWFYIANSMLPEYCCGNLQTTFRSTDEELKSLWNEARQLKDDNLILEELVRNHYSRPIDADKEIFDKKADDEIILCLNYNGLYGLNNINRLLQIVNKNKPVTINVWQFKVDDPILFNDSERFDILYNNLKGKIVGIEDFKSYVNFRIKVFSEFTKDEVEACEGLTFVSATAGETIVSFNVNRRPPYSSDEETDDKSHILPFEVAYAVSIHKSQGLEYDSVKIVIADDTEDKITHSIFYTAITRAKSFLTIFWMPEVCNKVIRNLKLPNYSKDYLILKGKYNL